MSIEMIKYASHKKLYCI